jgi:alcohol dehydrogenase class IV
MTFDSVYQYNFPTTIRFGAGSSKELGDYLIKNKISKPLIVTDATVAQLGFFKEIVKGLENKKITVCITQSSVNHNRIRHFVTCMKVNTVMIFKHCNVNGLKML